ncbi:nucleoside triphosphate pyrophosphohydrolase [Candidatus Viridilinea mediisalina]|uniref:Nucleoside triphosphate pyrophosphohydrolase n=1 Tax=Candidatus Viridilinea mediisalina TaxID=2024553 RepID=A0A2A6RLB9_9CHLR|nr:nucleoside triphosphate pyrophosphohydrolase [Candidatus Viridilinea mediisalina]PDW03904.1 nucleoside triphosphate pyrophosphohydrolase [Candidatus Viridilinea mediisalina]
MKSSTHSLTHSQLLDLASPLFGLEAHAGLQLWEGAALVAAARPPDVPTAAPEGAVRPWVETQGLGIYAPPVVPFPLQPMVPALLWWRAGAPSVAQHLVALLTTRYPQAHGVQVASLDTAGVAVATTELALGELAHVQAPAQQTILCYLPPLTLAADLRGAETLRWVMTRLLGPAGCPWDVRQSHQALRTTLLEEAHEVLEALGNRDLPALSEELGDLLINIMAHSEMARQGGHFALEDVLAQASSKLIRRHPHVFGTLAESDAETVRPTWEQIKAAELAAKGRARTSALEGVPPGLPALAAAQALGRKAARSGFNWATQQQVWAKLHEELEELAQAAAAGDTAHCAEEFGDLLFVLTRLADWLKFDAEHALHDANAKFRRRFSAFEAQITAQGRKIADCSLEEMLALWRTTK